MSRKAAALPFIRRLLVILFVYAGVFCALLLFMSFLFMFEGLAYEDELVGGYTVKAVDTRNNAAICMGSTQVIPPMVCAYGSNDDFIIARQHGTLDGRTIDRYTGQWYLIEVHNGKVHGPLTEQQFIGLRSELGVPTELTVTRTVQPDQ
jgi:hypothetical protein